VNSVLNLRVPYSAGKLPSVLQMGTFLVVLSSRELVSYAFMLTKFTTLTISL
jgi:hypothetical protein